MIDIKRILCPIDFSDYSRRAFDNAVAVARWYGATITLFHVSGVAPLPPFAPGGGNLPPAALTPEERTAILASMARFAEAEVGTSAPLECDVVEGRAAAEILRAAEALPADLLVMGTHGRSGFARLVLGSVTETVLRKAVCPVLTVPAAVPDAVPAAPGLFTRVLCAVDFSECSMHALEYAMSMAEEADATLTVMYVVEALPDVPREIHETVVTGPGNLLEFVARAEEAARARFKDIIPDNVRTYCTVDTVVATGKAYREILRVAGEQQADLLVIGVHGRGPIDRMLFGSTAQHLVRQAACPVLTLRKG